MLQCDLCEVFGDWEDIANVWRDGKVRADKMWRA